MMRGGEGLTRPASPSLSSVHSQRSSLLRWSRVIDRVAGGLQVGPQFNNDKCSPRQSSLDFVEESVISQVIDCKRQTHLNKAHNQ